MGALDALRVDPSSPDRRSIFLNHGEPQHQVEHLFAARANDTALSNHGWTELEKAVITTWRWWSTEELAAEKVQYFPENLVDLVNFADGQA